MRSPDANPVPTVPGRGPAPDARDMHGDTAETRGLPFWQRLNLSCTDSGLRGPHAA